ncbi:hypothetical protein [Sedimentitalea sp.]|uniref:nSTAND3 domain-containing NTPase n=1 Tax=Sedimentitalea sp. TaxID=2048915 RepID=UPI0032990CA6
MSDVSTVLGATGSVPLQLLGWKAFQDLAVAVAEECLRRPVQTFLPTSDAGRDGGFVGLWEGDDPAAGESTIQCKFTSRAGENLTLSMLQDELPKATRLAQQGLAQDYIIITNHPVTGASELKIREAFQQAGVGRCRIFGHDFIVRQIKTSPRLRMMAPRLYGLGDLTELLDARAYQQSQLILSSMGSDVQRLVVTEAHRRSVRAISEHNLVLLLGAPAAGKSTIGASIAVGAADIWKCGTIRATSPEDVQRHLDPNAHQFFWIDDAWGNTQYQRSTVDRWNQVFPLMQGAMRKGTRFLLTSRDYIWNAAQRDLKLQAMPALKKSQVIINVHELTTQERAQILYNHLKLGDQPNTFRSTVKQHLPILADNKEFLPETARRLGTQFFASKVVLTREGLLEFFEEPEDFLLDTISNLSDECKAAIAIVFLNGGSARSPVSIEDVRPASLAFGVSETAAKTELEALNGSLLNLAQDEDGPYWTYKHPTVSDSYSRYLAGSPEKIEVYLRGARSSSLVFSVVCPGINIGGAPVVVPKSHFPLLLNRISKLDVRSLRTFISYRANREFAEMLLKTRSDIMEISSFFPPIAEASDTSVFARLHSFELLPEDRRRKFVDAVRDAATEGADSSAFDGGLVENVLTESEKEEILNVVRDGVLTNIEQQVELQADSWDRDYPPDNHFDDLVESIERFVRLTIPTTEQQPYLTKLQHEVSWAVSRLDEDYSPESSTSAPTARSNPARAGLADLFRDVDADNS